MQPDITTPSSAEQMAMAKQALTDSGWPDRKNEAWKFTPLASRGLSELTPAQQRDPAELAVANGTDLSFVNGFAVSEMTSHQGISVEALSAENDVAAGYLARLPQDHHLTRLALSHVGAAVKITVTAAASQEKPFHIEFSGDGDGLSAHPFIVISVEAGASFCLRETHHSSLGLSAPLILIDIADGGRLDHIRLQNDSAVSTHLSLTHMTVGASASVNSFSLVRGGVLSRMETHVDFAAEQGDLVLSSVYLGTDEQHHDITTVIGHEKPHCTSHQLIRGVLADSSHGVFQGKVRVAPDAQKTDGQQMSRALLLSRDAVADAKPELEIFADDVVCSHGATVGELDETLMFYLKSRGIPFNEARAMLIEAFVADAVSDISNAELADVIGPEIQSWAVTHLRGGDDG